MVMRLLIYRQDRIKKLPHQTVRQVKRSYTIISSYLTLSKENVNVPKEKQAEAAVTAVPTTDKDEDIHAVVQQVINDDEDETEEADRTKRISVNKKWRKRDVPTEAPKKQASPKVNWLAFFFTELPNFGDFDTYSGKDDETKYGKP